MLKGLRWGEDTREPRGAPVRLNWKKEEETWAWSPLKNSLEDIIQDSASIIRCSPKASLRARR